MNERSSWPDEQNPITKISFALMTGFDSDGQPVYRTGEVESEEERKTVQSILEPLQPFPHTITSVAMGEIRIELQDGTMITLRPVFHPSSDEYRDLFFVDQSQYEMPSSLAAHLERWRTETER